MKTQEEPISNRRKKRSKKNYSFPTIALICLSVVGFLTFPLLSEGFEYSYQKRGKGDNVRSEGLKTDKKAGTLLLLSFIAYKSKWETDDLPKNLTIKFFSPEESVAYISVREIQSLRSYRMDVERNVWGIGWMNKFTWPSRDVIAPLEIDIKNLGIVISSKRYGGSGKIYPALFFSNQLPSRISTYTLTVQCKYTCAPLTWTIRPMHQESDAKIQSGSIKRLRGGKPHEITLQASWLKEGWHRIRLRWEKAGRGSGAGDENQQVRDYDFYHMPIIR